MTLMRSYLGLRRIRHSLLTIILLLCFSFWLPQPAFAFDTGDHSDLTRQALSNEGFAETPNQIVQVQNWLVDYFSNTPNPFFNTEEVEILHFDNLFTTDQIRNYWGRLSVNMRNAVQEAAREKDTLKLLTLLGASLHAVQDFYSHSNWVETHPRAASGSFSPETWFDSPPAPGSPRLYTGYYPNDNKPAEAVEPHGTYTTGLNKDSYVRQLPPPINQQPRDWQTAYAFAYAASRQWVNAVRAWVNEVDPAFWGSVQTVSLGSADRSALDKDLEASYRISEWVKTWGAHGADGHWKGNGSGSAAEFVAFAGVWTASSDSRFVDEFKERKIHRLLSNGLTGNSPPTSAVPAVPRIALNQRAIILRTLQVAEKNDVGFFEQKIDPGGNADFYAKISINGQTFVEAMQLDRSSVSPAWTAIKFVPTTTARVPIRYELWDEDGAGRGDDDRCDINPITGIRDLDFTFDVASHNTTGNITGVHDRSASAVTSEGRRSDSDRAIVQFYVTERSL